MVRQQDLKSSTAIEVYEIRWSWNKRTDLWLLRQCKGFTLNICCGMSKIGDIRADIDPTVKPDVICDMDHLPFKKDVFDTVVCDPPFSKFNRFKWIVILSNYAKSRFIISSPGGLFPRLKGFKTEYKATIQRGLLFVRYWFFYDRKNQILTNFTLGAKSK